MKKNIINSIFFATILLFIGLRLPFLSQPLLGEEGMFGVIITGYKSSTVSSYTVERGRIIDENCLTIVGHIGSEGDLMTRPSRNIAPYCFLGLVVKPLISGIDFPSLNFDDKSKLVRSTFLLISSVGYISLCIIGWLIASQLMGYQKVLPFLFLLGITATPLALGASIQPQLDGVFGYLLLSNAVLFVYLGAKNKQSPWSKMSLNFLAGFLVALCKNEWSLVLLASIASVFFAWLAYSFFASRQAKCNLRGYFSNLNLSVILGLLMGCLMGMYACFWFSPGDYLDGFNLMRDINNSKNSHLTIFITALVSNYYVLIPNLLVLAAGSWAAIKNRNALITNQIGLLALYLWSFGVTAGFMQSGWSGDGFPRYYVPPLLVGSGFLMTQLPAIFVGIHRGIIIFLAGLFVLFACKEYKFSYDKFSKGISVTVPQNYMEAKDKITLASKIYEQNSNYVLAFKSTIRVYFPKTNFISSDLSFEDINRKAESLKGSGYQLITKEGW